MVISYIGERNIMDNPKYPISPRTFNKDWITLSYSGIEECKDM
jgi:hypothetical protein